MPSRISEKEHTSTYHRDRHDRLIPIVRTIQPHPVNPKPNVLLHKNIDTLIQRTQRIEPDSRQFLLALASQARQRRIAGRHQNAVQTPERHQALLEVRIATRRRIPPQRQTRRRPALHNHGTKQVLARTAMRGVARLHPDVEAARALAEDGGARGIAAEGADVVVQPLERQPLVLQPGVHQPLAGEQAVEQEAQPARTVVHGRDDDARVGGCAAHDEAGDVVGFGFAADVGAAVDEDHDGELGAVVGFVSVGYGFGVRDFLVLGTEREGHVRVGSARGPEDVERQTVLANGVVDHVLGVLYTCWAVVRCIDLASRVARGVRHGVCEAAVASGGFSERDAQELLNPRDISVGAIDPLGRGDGAGRLAKCCWGKEKNARCKDERK